MNIGLFTDTYMPQINGVGSSVCTLARQLRLQGHTVYIFAPWSPDTQENEEEQFVIRMPSMPFVFLKGFRVGLCYPPKAINKIVHLKLDIVHTQTEFSLGTFGRILAKSLNLPVVHTYHTMYEDYVHYIVNGERVTARTKKEARKFSALFCNTANAVIAPTKKVEHYLHEYGVTRPISIIPTGINLKKFQKSNFSPEDIKNLRNEYGLADENKTVLVLGRIAQEKSIDVVIKAMPSLFERMDYARLVIVGDGPCRDELEKLAESLNIADKVIFTGAKPWAEIGKYYQLGDVFVTASVSETQGLTFAEAMAAEVPIIAKKDESIGDVIEDEYNGFVFETDSALADRIYELLSDDKKRAALTKNALIYASSMSAETFADRVEHLYADILSDPEKYNYNPNRVSKIAKPFLASKRAVAVVNNEIEADIKATADTVNVIKNIALNNKNRLKKLYDELLR